MNWIKDNVIMVLAAAAGVLLLVAAVFFVLWRLEVADHATTTQRLKTSETQMAEAVSASRDNATKLKALQTDYNQLVERHQLETAASKRAGQRIAQLQRELANQTEANRNYREQLRRDRPDIDDYLSQPVPVELYERLLEGPPGQD